MFEFLKNKNKPSGYAGLDRFKKLAISVIPTELLQLINQANNNANNAINIANTVNDNLNLALSNLPNSKKAIIKVFYNNGLSYTTLYNNFGFDFFINEVQYLSQPIHFYITSNYFFSKEYCWLSIYSNKFVNSRPFMPNPEAKFYTTSANLFYFLFYDKLENLVDPPSEFIIEINELRPIV